MPENEFAASNSEIERLSELLEQESRRYCRPLDEEDEVRQR